MGWLNIVVKVLLKAFIWSH